jgi:hypothetical protein
MFGNFDNSPWVRTTDGLLAQTHVILLKVKTNILYKLAKDYPQLSKKLELALLLNRVSIIPE